MQKFNRLSKWMIVLSFIVVLTGCWDRKEIEKRATILGLAIDLAEEGEEESSVTHPSDEKIPTSKLGKIKISAQLAVPGQVPLGPSQGGGTTPTDTVWVVEGVGHTMDDAIENIQQQLAHQIFFGQLQIIIISEDVAKKGVGHINEYLRRRPDIRRTAWMAVNGEDAAKTMEASPKLERIPSIYLSTMFEEAVKMGKFPEDDLGRFWIQTSNKGEDGFLPFVTVKSQENIEISGIAYFSNEKMVGKTKPYQITYFSGLIGEKPGGATAVVKLNENQSVMLQSIKRKSNYEVELRHGKPYVKINVDIWGIIKEKNLPDIKLEDHKTLVKIEKKAEDLIEKEMEKFILELQKNKSDILGIGEYVRGDLSAYWDDHIETGEKWRDLFQQLPFEIKANVLIKRVGMKAS